MSALSVEGGNLFLYSGQDQIPEFGGSFQVIEGDVFESVADLKVGEVLAVLLEDEGIVTEIVATLQCGIGLVEYVVVNVRDVVVASSVHLSLGREPKARRS